VKVTGLPKLWIGALLERDVVVSGSDRISLLLNLVTNPPVGSTLYAAWILPWTAPAVMG
jgi:hypothetical protein